MTWPLLRSTGHVLSLCVSRSLLLRLFDCQFGPCRNDHTWRGRIPIKRRPTQLATLKVETWSVCHLTYSISSGPASGSCKSARAMSPTLFIPEQSCRLNDSHTRSDLIHLLTHNSRTRHLACSVEDPWCHRKDTHVVIRPRTISRNQLYVS